MAPSRTPSELMAMMVMRMGSSVYSQLFSLPDEGPPAPEVGEEELLQSPSYSSMAQNTQDYRHEDIVTEVPQPPVSLGLSSEQQALGKLLCPSCIFWDLEPNLFPGSILSSIKWRH